MRRYAGCLVWEASGCVHGTSQFGDGIMSMIDCKVNIERKPDPKGDRVVLTFEYVSNLFSRQSSHEHFIFINSGKFLPYLKW